jgi:hypothetical protein
MINFGITEQKKEELEQRMQKCNLFEIESQEKIRDSGVVKKVEIATSLRSSQ